MPLSREFVIEVEWSSGLVTRLNRNRRMPLSREFYLMVEWNSGLHILSLNGVVEQWVTRLKSQGWRGAVGNTAEGSMVEWSSG